MATSTLSSIVRSTTRVICFASFFCTGLVSCATPSIESSPLPQPVPPATPWLVVPDDALEFRFLLRPITQSEPYRVDIGDQLRVNVFNHEELTQKNVLVLPDGHISLPLIPRLKVSGNPVELIAEQIASRYREHQIRDPDVTVSVETDRARLRDFLTSVHQSGGQQGVRVPVEQDGAIAVPALAPIMANRPFGEIRREVQAAYVAEFGPELAVVVRLVPRDHPTLVHVIGEVTNPGSVAIDEKTNLNALTAVARAGGFLRTANVQKVRVYRFSQQDGVSQWEVDLAEGLQQGVQLQILAEDVIFVPKTGIAKANDWMDQYIRRMLPTSIGVGISYDINDNND